MSLEVERGGNELVSGLGHRVEPGSELDVSEVVGVGM
jgi:hypothetical protein